VLTELSTYADSDGWCYPKQSTIGANLGGISRSAVAQHLAKLVKLGYIEVQAQHGADGSQVANLYRVVLDTPPVRPLANGGALGNELTGGVRPLANAKNRPTEQTKTDLARALDHVEAKEPEPTPKKPRARQLRDDYFDAIVACFGQASTKSRAAMYAQVAGELLAAKAEPGQVALAHAELMRRGWENPTPIAMVKHWDDLLASAKPRRRGTNYDKIAERDREVRDGAGAGSVGAVRRGG
jgi:DNA-binding transcriptional ArsR family regulator